MKRELILQDIQKLLTEELKCYRRLIELSERQRHFIRLGDTDALMNVLAQKEILITKISQLEGDIQPAFRQFPQFQQQMPEPVNRLINKISAILKQITVVEKESETLLIEKYNEIKEELGNLKQTKTILKTYAPQRAYRPRFIDKKT
jgi:hypothetical protein